MITDVTSEQTPKLVMDAAAGSRAAFAQLVRRNHESVRTFLCRHLPHPDAADDLAQEVFLTAYRQISTYHGQGRFESWLLGIARNKALEYLRSESRRKQRDLRAALARWQVERLQESAQDPAEHQRVLLALRSCLDALPPASRRLVDRFYFAEESAESIGLTMDRKPGAVRMALLRIRQILADCVAGKTEGEGMLLPEAGP